MHRVVGACCTVPWTPCWISWGLSGRHDSKFVILGQRTALDLVSFLGRFWTLELGQVTEMEVCSLELCLGGNKTQMFFTWVEDNLTMIGSPPHV